MTSYYRAHVTVGDYSWVIEQGDAPAYGPTAPLSIGWDFPEDDPRPQQPTPVEARFGIIVEQPADLAGVDIGTPVSVAIFTDPADYDPPTPFTTAPALALFAGRITELEAEPTTLGMHYTITAADYLADLIAQQGKDLGGGPTTIAQQNQPGSRNNYQLPPIRDYVDELAAQAGLPSLWLYPTVPPNPDTQWGLHTLGLGIRSLFDLIVGVLRSYLLLTPGTDGERGIVLPGTVWDTDTWTAALNPAQPFYVDFYGKRMQTAAPGRVPPGQWGQVGGSGGEPEPEFQPVGWRSAGWRYLIATETDTVDRSAPSLDDSAWNLGAAPFGNGLAPSHAALGWEAPQTALPTSQTSVWLRRHVSASPGEALSVGVRVDGAVRVYWNGALLADPGEAWSLTTGSYAVVPPEQVLADNVLAVRVVDDAGDPSGDFTALDVRVDYVGAFDSTNYAAAILSRRPICYYRMNETGGTVMVDSSGNGRDGVYLAPPDFGVPGGLVGDADTAADWNNDRASVPYGAWQSPSFITITALVNIDGTGQYMIAERDAQGGTGRRSWQFRIANRVLQFLILNQVNASIPLTIGQWHHIAATYDGATARVYVDGVEAGSIARAGVLASGGEQELFIGRSSALVWPTDGRIDEVAIFDRALSGGDIASLYAAATTAPTEPEPDPDPPVSSDPWAIYVDPDVGGLPEDLAALWPYPVTAAESGIIPADTVDLDSVSWKRTKSAAVDTTEIGWSGLGDGAGNGGAERVYRFSNTPRPIPVVRSLGQVHAYNGAIDPVSGQVAFLGRYYTPEPDTKAPKFSADKFLIRPTALGHDPHRISAGGWRNLLRPDSALGNPLVVIAGIRDGWNPNPGAPDWYAGTLRGARLTIQRGDYQLEVQIDQNIPRPVRSTSAADGYMSWAAQRDHPTYSTIAWSDVHPDVTWAQARLLRRP